jgi:hypothetical protein
VPPTRLQRSGASLEELRESVRSEFGPSARIVSAEKVTSAGLGGLFRKAHYEATVEIPGLGDEPTARISIAADAPTRAGILALLDDADADEDRLSGRRARRDPVADARETTELATRSDAFAALMDDFTFNGIAPGVTLGEALGEPGRPAGPTPSLPSVPPATQAGEDDDPRAAFEAVARSGGAARVTDDGPLPTPPAVSTADGDLVALVGRGADVAGVVDAFAAAHALRVVDASDRRGGILARAAGVQDGVAVLSALAWPADLGGLAPDQTWAVVDAGRKHDDTAAFVRALASTTSVAGLVVVGMGETSTPETVHMLGLPVIDARGL